MNVQEVSKKLGISKNSIYKMLKSEELIGEKGPYGWEIEYSERQDLKFVRTLLKDLSEAKSKFRELDSLLLEQLELNKKINLISNSSILPESIEVIRKNNPISNDLVIDIQRIESEVENTEKFYYLVDFLLKDLKYTLVNYSSSSRSVYINLPDEYFPEFLNTLSLNRQTKFHTRQSLMDSKGYKKIRISDHENKTNSYDFSVVLNINTKMSDDPDCSESNEKIERLKTFALIPNKSLKSTEKEEIKSLYQELSEDKLTASKHSKFLKYVIAKINSF